MNTLCKRIEEISRKHDLSHLGSCYTSVNIIDEIYSKRKPDEPFVLSCGHAFLALAVVLEKYEGKDAEALCLKHGTHPSRNLGDGVYCSTGSLGWGFSISVGMALANRKRNVWVLLSDGELAEGICWECANVIDKYKIKNLKIFVNFNNYGAYDFIPNSFKEKIQFILPTAQIVHTSVKDYGFKGQEAHYVKV